MLSEGSILFLQLMLALTQLIQVEFQRLGKFSNSIACAILLYKFELSIDLSAAEVLACRTMSYIMTSPREQSLAVLLFSLYISSVTKPLILTTLSIRFPNISLSEALESASINKIALSFSMRMMPGLFSNTHDALPISSLERTQRNRGSL